MGSHKAQLLDLLIKKDANIANYADDTTPYELQNDIGSVINNLETGLFQWFAYNAIKANPDKSHLLLSNKKLSLSAKIDGNLISNENNVKLLDITFDNDLSFNKHVSSLCDKAT